MCTFTIGWLAESGRGEEEGIEKKMQGGGIISASTFNLPEPTLSVPVKGDTDEAMAEMECQEARKGKKEERRGGLKIRRLDQSALCFLTNLPN